MGDVVKLQWLVRECGYACSLKLKHGGNDRDRKFASGSGGRTIDGGTGENGGGVTSERAKERTNERDKPECDSCTDEGERAAARANNAGVNMDRTRANVVYVSVQSSPLMAPNLSRQI